MTKANPQIIAIAGPNGAGKSTLAPFLIRDDYGLMEYVNADSIAIGLAAFSPESVAFESGRIMLKRLRDLAEQKVDFAFETTLASRTYATWIADLRDKGYEFHLIYLWLNSADLAVQRVRERVRRGGHDVPEEVIRRRYAKGAWNFFRLYRELADTWGIYDNSNSDRLAPVAIQHKGAILEVLQEGLWTHFSEVGR